MELVFCSAQVWREITCIEEELWKIAGGYKNEWTGAPYRSISGFQKDLGPSNITIDAIQV